MGFCYDHELDSFVCAYVRTQALTGACEVRDETEG
jgi:hypothetical protein